MFPKNPILLAIILSAACLKAIEIVEIYKAPYSQVKVLDMETPLKFALEEKENISSSNNLEGYLRAVKSFKQKLVALNLSKKSPSESPRDLLKMLPKNLRSEYSRLIKQRASLQLPAEEMLFVTPVPLWSAVRRSQ